MVLRKAVIEQHTKNLCRTLKKLGKQEIYLSLDKIYGTGSRRQYYIMSNTRDSFRRTASSSVRLLCSNLPGSPKDLQACRFVLHHLTFRNSGSGILGVTGDVLSNNWRGHVTTSAWPCYHSAGYRTVGGSCTKAVSSDLQSNFWHGPVTASAWPCYHTAGYRTAAGDRTPAGGRDNTNLPTKGQRSKTEDRERDDDSDKGDKDKPAESSSSGSIFQRFKQAYKEHGKILVGVHLVTSLVWSGSFYYAASKGINVVPWLEYIGISETIIKPFRSPNVGNIAMAYLMYKLATPARYTVTIGGTNMVIRYMRRTGRLDPIPEGDSIRELYKEGKREIRKKQPLVIPKQRVKHHKKLK